MAMNKKEQAEMADLKHQLALARAFRFTEPVEKDVPPPAPESKFGELSIGWTYILGRKEVFVACSSITGHSIGRTDETRSQRPMQLYSTKLLALKGLRHEMEQVYAKELARIDALIAQEQAASEGGVKHG